MRTKLSLRSAIVLTTLFATLSGTAPAAAAQTESPYGPFNWGDAQLSGNLVWHSGSVQVGGVLQTDTYCAAAVYTAFDSAGRVAARATRPADSVYHCYETRGHGFSLTPVAGTGTPQRVVVSFWVQAEVKTQVTCLRSTARCS